MAASGASVSARKLAWRRRRPGCRASLLNPEPVATFRMQPRIDCPVSPALINRAAM
jgi:hypothetical protein